jgi:hypothetical protein
VHVIHDFRTKLPTEPYAPSASVINAIFVNATTTMVGFGSMMIAAHRGLYSLGLVLTIGVGTCLLVSVVLVPAILVWMTRHRAVRAVELLPADLPAEIAAEVPAQIPQEFAEIPAESAESSETLQFLRAAEWQTKTPSDEDQFRRAA